MTHTPDKPGSEAVLRVASEMRSRYAPPTGHGASHDVIAGHAVDVSAMLVRWAERLEAALTRPGEAGAGGVDAERIADSLMMDAVTDKWSGRDAIVAAVRKALAALQAGSAPGEAQRDVSIPVEALAQQLTHYANPGCRECDGTGVWMGNVLVCGCVLDGLPPSGSVASGAGDAVSGEFPAPIRNPEAWPERYADGYNDALQLVIDCGFATRPAGSVASLSTNPREIGSKSVDGSVASGAGDADAEGVSADHYPPPTQAQRDAFNAWRDANMPSRTTGGWRVRMEDDPPHPNPLAIVTAPAGDEWIAVRGDDPVIWDFIKHLATRPAAMSAAAGEGESC